MPKILVADDNTNIQKMVVLAFQERGIEVVAVGNGESAVRKLNDVNPDLVLADVFMPVRNGYEVCEFIKKDTRTSHVPVILLVGAFDPLDEKEARRVGADGVLKKPFVPPDPLIAMVMSALEKNPRVAAELAKAKEAPPEPAPLPALEIQAKKEPVPLPSFPDPTPEEAAAIYGFGKGVRGDEEEGDAKGAPAPKRKASDEEDEEEFDGASTQSNWRRAGMDLEIPEDIAGQPSFSTEQELAPITFPSERDVPPRHVRVEEPAAQAIEFVKAQPEPEYEAISQTKEPAPETVSPAAQAEWASAPAAEPAETFEVPQAEAHEPEPASSEASIWMSAPAVAPAVQEAAQEDAPVVSPTLAQAAEEIAEPAASLVASEIASAPKAEEAAEQEMSAAPRQATHWMDLMTADASGGAQESSWQAAFAPQEETPAQVAEPISARDTTEAIAEVAAEAATESKAAETAQTAVEEPRSFGEPSRPDRGGFSYHFASSEISEDKKEVPEEVREEVRDEVRAALHEREMQTANTEENLPAYSNIANGAAPGSQPRALQRVFEARAESPAQISGGTQADQSYSGSPADAGDGEGRETSASHAEEAAEKDEADSFFAPEPAAPAEETHPAEEPADSKTKSFFDALAERSSERIPTSAPQTREDLAGIPFLAPPSAAHGTNGSSQATEDKAIDSLVQKVLERLEPQLHDLLSKGVLKPLIENLLQQELEKKDR